MTSLLTPEGRPMPRESINDDCWYVVKVDEGRIVRHIGSNSPERIACRLHGLPVHPGMALFTGMQLKCWASDAQIRDMHVRGGV